MSSAEENNISTDVFFQDNFAIDEYLATCTQKSELTTLRNELKTYGTHLYTTMVDILKMETEGIVDLAESVTNLNCKIDELSIPISQLCEEIRTLNLAINDTKAGFDKHLNIVQSIHTRRDHINLKLGMISCSSYINNIIANWVEEDITVLERAVNEFSFQYLYLKEMQLAEVIIDKDVQKTSYRLLELIHTVFYKALKANHGEIILRCLRMYANLARQNDAEDYVRKGFVRPGISLIMTSRNLGNNNQDVKVLYDQALTFLHNDMKTLLDVLEINTDVKGFNFVLNSFWVEVNKQLCDNLSNITAPGNPELFQKRYNDSWNFLQEISSVAKDTNLSKKDPSFLEHMKRFNLPVYFEIRFQQIAAKFEYVMLFNSMEFTNEQEDTQFNLRTTSMLWNCMRRCFHDEVFLIPLCDQFLKLMMLLLSRYIKWFENQLKEWKSLGGEPTYFKLEQFIIHSLIDMSSLKDLVGFSVTDVNEYDETVFKIIPFEIRAPVNKILQLNNQSLAEIYTKVQTLLVDFKVQQSGIHLQQVTSIPRLYRRTNRNIPKEPSNYVVEAVFPIVQLYKNYQMIMGDKIVLIMDLAIKQLSDQYVALVQEVLHSVCKTEESLRRLKNRNYSGTEEPTQGNPDGRTDETKIREQIKLDVGHFVNELKPFALQDSKISLQLLMAESGYTVSSKKN